MKKFPLQNGGYALIDNENYDYLHQWKWYRNIDGYAQRRQVINGKRVCFLMHRIVGNIPDGLITDHINGNRLDNRKINLRVCSFAQNARNYPKQKTARTSKFKGVVLDRNPNRKKNYKVMIRINKHSRILVGYFYTEKEAAKAYNQAALKHHGTFARLNVF
jgi:hypothetical protein